MNEENYRLIIQHQQEQYENMIMKSQEKTDKDRLTLKPCPCCKNQAINLMRKEIKCLNRDYMCKGDKQFWVECGFCHITTATYDDPEHAIMAWNRRDEE